MCDEEVKKGLGGGLGRDVGKSVNGLEHWMKHAPQTCTEGLAQNKHSLLQNQSFGALGRS